MTIAAVCCTYNRPRHLGRLIRCFLDQDYPDCELLILDDAGQYKNQEGDRWRIVSFAERFPSLGAKRNAAAAMLGSHVEAFCPWDDDDLYLPWALSATAAGLLGAEWSVPSQVYSLEETRLKLLAPNARGWCVNASWGIDRSLFNRLGGYGLLNVGEDGILKERLWESGVRVGDPIKKGFKPYLIYTRVSDTYHISSFKTPAEWEEIAVSTPSNKLPIIIPDTNPALELLKGHQQ